MGEPDDRNRRPVPDPHEVQAHITAFWSGVAPDYETHAGNVAAYGSAEYQRWARAMAGWRALLRPGGRLVAVDGFWFGGDDGDVPPFFAEHYTADTRGGLPFMHLDGPEPILGMLAAAGFVDLAAKPRPELDLGSGVPYLITATRP